MYAEFSDLITYCVSNVPLQILLIKAEENLRTTETMLAARLEELSAVESKYSEGIKEYEQKLEQMLEKYENVRSFI